MIYYCKSWGEISPQPAYSEVVYFLSEYDFLIIEISSMIIRATNPMISASLEETPRNTNARTRALIKSLYIMNSK